MPQNATPASDGATSITAQYDRAAVCRPIAGVVRSGDDLIASRGADLSAYCIHCGCASAGKPMVLRYVPTDAGVVDLAGSTDDPIGGLVGLLFLSVSAVLNATVPRLRAWHRAQTLSVAIGLCDRHLRRRRRLLRAAGVALLVSLGLLVGGLWAWIRARYQTGDDTTVALSVMIAGLVFAILGPVLIGSRLRTPRLTAAQGGRVLITGAGQAFVDAQAILAS